MPSLDWSCRKYVLHHHREIPYHLLRIDEHLCFGDQNTGNLLVEGDNLLALKALLPYYAGQVKCIYIDPPYNTGNEAWTYNDNVNSPIMREWLAAAVGKEGEDLCRHDKWLCMMYPRMQLLKDFLRDDGAIFVSIDDNEFANLRLLMDEVFGANNFISTIIWQKVYSPKNSAKHFSEDHDYIVVYARSKEKWRPNLVPRTDKQDKAYKNPDNDERGPWKTSDLSARNYYSKGTYSITCPSGRVILAPPKGRYWQVSPEEFANLIADNRIWWGKSGNSIPQRKRLLLEVKKGVVPQTLWPYSEVGHTQEAKQELVSMVNFEDSDSVFVTPKPTRLIKRILQIATDKDSLVLDSFAGSGTTGQAVLNLNREDGGHRRFLMVEMETDICRNVTIQRLKSAIGGYTRRRGQSEEVKVEGLGGGYRFCRLSEPLFDETGKIRKDVAYEDLAAHVFFAASGRPLGSLVTPPLIGTANGVAYYLLYDQGDMQTVLTDAVARGLPPHNGERVVYADKCLLSPSRLRSEEITFRQIPYEIEVS